MPDRRLPAIELARAAIPVTLACLLMAGGCAATAAPQGAEQSAVDPWEPMNRRVDRFNTEVDRLTLKPVAKGYEKVVPDFMQQGITNFSRNLRGPLNIVNNFLQGDGSEGFSETGRFLANSTLGIGGLFDVASRMGLERYNEDFGQTLAVWGVPSGPYVVVPFFGPQTLRDAFALPLDFLADPLTHYRNERVRYSLFTLRAIDLRARFLSVEDFVEDSYDRYIAIRESYLQHRQYEVYDGDPPMDEDFYDDFLEELPEPE
jgi:phospholipid-binding lipoprotein MlaA